MYQLLLMFSLVGPRRRAARMRDGHSSVQARRSRLMSIHLPDPAAPRMNVSWMPWGVGAVSIARIPTRAHGATSPATRIKPALSPALTASDNIRRTGKIPRAVAFPARTRAESGVVKRTIETVITSVEPDGLTQVRWWRPDSADDQAMRAAGIGEHQTGPCTIDPCEGGLFGAWLTADTARELRRCPTFPMSATWSPDGPAWAGLQRGESGLWIHLPSGRWIGIAPADLEEVDIFLRKLELPGGRTV